VIFNIAPDALALAESSMIGAVGEQKQRQCDG
jgi:hypothetical protein